MVPALKPVPEAAACPDCGHHLIAISGGYQCSGRSCRWVTGDVHDLLAARLGGYDKLPNLDDMTIRALKARRRILKTVTDARWRHHKTGPYMVRESELTKRTGLSVDVWRQFYVILSKEELLMLADDVLELNFEATTDLPERARDWYHVMPYFTKPYQIGKLVIGENPGRQWDIAPALASFAGIMSLDPKDTRELFLVSDQASLTALLGLDPDARALAWEGGEKPVLPPGRVAVLLTKPSQIIEASRICTMLPEVKVAMFTAAGVSRSRYLYSDALCMAITEEYRTHGQLGALGIINSAHIPDDVIPKLSLTPLGLVPDIMAALASRLTMEATKVEVTSEGFKVFGKVITDFTLKPVQWRMLNTNPGKLLECEITIGKAKAKIDIPVDALRNAKAFVKVMDRALVDGRSPRVVARRELDHLLAWLLSKTQGLKAVHVVPWPGYAAPGYHLPGICVTAKDDADSGLARDDRFGEMMDFEVELQGQSLHMLLVAGALVARAAAGKPVPALRLAATGDSDRILGDLMNWLGQLRPLVVAKSVKPFVHVAPREEAPVQGSIGIAQVGETLTDSQEVVSVNPRHFLVYCVRRALNGTAAFLAHVPSLGALTAEGAAAMDARYPDKLPVRLDMLDMPACCKLLKLVAGFTADAFKFDLRSQSVVFDTEAYACTPVTILKELKKRDPAVYTDGQKIYIPDATLRAMLLTYHRKVMPVGHIGM